MKKERVLVHKHTKININLLLTEHVALGRGREKDRWPNSPVWLEQTRFVSNLLYGSPCLFIYQNFSNLDLAIDAVFHVLLHETVEKTNRMRSK